MAGAPAGWYQDPENPRQRRYWDGIEWTQNVSLPPAQTQAPAQPAKASSNNTRNGVLALVFILGLLITCCSFSGVLSKSSKPRTVTYTVDGTATSGQMTYAATDGATQQETAPLPWTRQVQMKPGEYVYISAQNQDDGGDIAVHILVDGKEIKTAQSSGAYVIAQTSGSCP